MHLDLGQLQPSTSSIGPTSSEAETSISNFSIPLLRLITTESLTEADRLLAAATGLGVSALATVAGVLGVAWSLVNVLPSAVGCPVRRDGSQHTECTRLGTST